jgi:segregation and condensation protein B
METLAVVAYRQPIIRADVESIRGVACGDMIRKLMEKGLVKIVGRAEVLGRPMLYGTTRKFLEVFGLSDLEDLPGVEELRGGAQEESPQASQEDSAEQTDKSNPSQVTAPQADAQEPDEQTEPAADEGPDDTGDAEQGAYAPEETPPEEIGQEGEGQEEEDQQDPQG